MTGPLASLGRYVTTRYRASLFAPLTAAIAAVSMIGRGDDLNSLAQRGLVIAILLFALRLWDDLVDLEHDRVKHPERELCTTRHLGAFRLTQALTSALGTILAGVLLGTASLTAVLALHAFLTGWYFFTVAGFRRGPGGWRDAFRYHGVLAKYPALVFLAAGAPWPPAQIFGAVLVAVYLAACVYEAVHDPLIGGQPAVRRLLRVEVALLALLALCGLVFQIAEEFTP